LVRFWPSRTEVYRSRLILLFTDKCERFRRQLWAGDQGVGINQPLRYVGLQRFMEVERDNLNCEAYVKHLVTGRTDEKPLGDIALLLKHRVKTVFISA